MRMMACVVGGAQEGVGESVGACMRVCLLLSHEKANPSVYYNTGWSILLSEMLQRKINAVRLHQVHWRANQK